MPSEAKIRQVIAEHDGDIMRVAERLIEVLEHNTYLVKQILGSKTEKVDPNQLWLMEAPPVEPDPAAESSPGAVEPSTTPRRRSRRRKPRIPENLPVEEVRLKDPQEVQDDPEAYRCIGEEVTEELDVIPPRYLRRQIIRRKYVRIDDRDRAPIVAPLPPRLIPGGYAGIGLLLDIIFKKYLEHLPLYRQSQTLLWRFGIDLSRQTMCDWVEVVANWLKPIYNHIGDELRQNVYLQIDETPITYNRARHGGSRKGYLWTYHIPALPGHGRCDAQVYYEWHTSRSADCLEGMLQSFRGTIQSDGYGAYASYCRRHGAIDEAACWAHARRKFVQAHEDAPGATTAWIIAQIGQLYRIERDLREADASVKMRALRRGVESQPILRRLRRALVVKQTAYRPKSRMGKAIAYTLRLWDRLTVYASDGLLEIDNNLVENAIRPSAVGKRNWLFFGSPRAGEHAAIIYTLLENCKRLGINPEVYLRDVLTRLPGLMNHETGELTPVNWLLARVGETEVA